MERNGVWKKIVIIKALNVTFKKFRYFDILDYKLTFGNNFYNVTLNILKVNIKHLKNLHPTRLKC